SGYAANAEKCEIGARVPPSKGYFVGEPSGALEDVHTPGCPGIEDVAKFMKVKPQHMLKSVLFRVDANAEELAKSGEEYILAVVGDPSPRADAKLEARRGIEVGHIFKLGTKYSDAMGFAVLDHEQQKRSVIMGCYGIGVSRTMAAAVEQNNDADGIIWPAAIAPYHALVVIMKHDDPRQADAAMQAAAKLAAAGYDVLIDDRDERPGVKFKDADLI